MTDNRNQLEPATQSNPAKPSGYLQVTPQTVAGETCIHIRFEGQNAPCFAHGRTYMRVADADRQLSAAELEAIINAFCHRDWRDPDYVQVAIFKDRVEIRNPGTLYGGLTIEDLRRGNVSKRRNPLIADLFRRIEMVESRGRGMTLIHQNTPSVTFRQVAGLFIASFARPSFSLNDQETTGTTENTKKTTQKPLENNVEATQKPHASPREKLLNLLKAQPAINTKDLAQLSGATLYSVRHHLESLKAEGRIRHVGPNKGGRWEVFDLPEPGSVP